MEKKEIRISILRSNSKIKMTLNGNSRSNLEGKKAEKVG